MFTILVADDEPSIRRGIIRILKKGIAEPLDIRESENGNDAILQIQNIKFDLIITDIEMPACNGLDFIERLNNYYRSPHVVVLSGYEKFAYAQRSIQLGVKNYLTKPISTEKLLKVVENHIMEIKSHDAIQHGLVQEDIKNRKIISQAVDDAFIALLTAGSIDEVKKTNNKLRTMGVDLDSTIMDLSLIMYEVNTQNKDYIDFIAKNVVGEVLEQKYGKNHCFLVTLQRGRLALLLKHSRIDSPTESDQRILIKAANALNKAAQVRVCIGIGAIAITTEQLPTAVRTAVQNLNQKLFDPSCLLFNATREIFLAPLSQERKACEALFKNSRELSITKILAQIDYICASPYSSDSLNLLKWIGKQATQIALSNGMETYDVIEFEDFWDLLQYRKYLCHCISYINHQQAKSITNETSHRVINEITAYIDDHLGDHTLSLNALSHKFNLSANYISQLFSKTLGVGFNTYLTCGRIERAKMLLEMESVRITEVGELCGYDNAKYFSIVFKKMTALTPSGYRHLQLPKSKI